MPQLLDDFCQLLQQVRSGSEDAVWELINEYGDAVRQAVRHRLNQKLRSKFDSMDFVQLVWGSLFRARDKLERFERPEELVKYLVVMARNKVGMECRRQLQAVKRNVAREQSLDQLMDQPGEELAGSQPTPVDTAIARERWNRLLEGQPRHRRLIIQLRLQGYTNQDIARALHLDESTVRCFLKRLLATVSP
jgi:RNA polymerase sigma-70 factor (ECF subfamily)